MCKALVDPGAPFASRFSSVTFCFAPWIWRLISDDLTSNSDLGRRVTKKRVSRRSEASGSECKLESEAKLSVVDMSDEPTRQPL